MLVTFEDINNPATMRFVDPRDLFGPKRPGYSLEKADVQITLDEPEFAPVLRVLPWLADWTGAVFATNRETMPDTLFPIYSVTRFGKGYFIQEEF